MSNEKSHKIDAIKYFVPLPEGDYDFQEHLTDYLLTDILNANKQLEKYEARVKELEEKLKRKEQECEQIKEKYEALKLENQEGYEIVAELKHECEELKNNLHIANTNHEAAEQECDRYRKALDEIEGLVSKVDVADECSYGDFNCSNCDDDCTCPAIVKRLILDIINKAKGEE